MTDGTATLMINELRTMNGHLATLTQLLQHLVQATQQKKG
jgi:hypothetical protein